MNKITQETQKPKALVRLIQAGDKADWRRMFDAYLAFYQTTLTEEIIGLAWQRMLDQEDGMVGLIAHDSAGQAVGIANLVFHRATWAKNYYCYLEDLYVDENVRGTGAGRALIEATYAEADRRGASRTYWLTHQDNATARKLYDRVGRLTPFLRYDR